jgi:phosphocarrier protein
VLKKTLTISNKLGLHARAAMKLVDAASRYTANVTVLYNGRRCDAKDILQAMSLGAAMGSTIELEVDGDGEAESMAALTKLINDKFGED